MEETHFEFRPGPGCPTRETLEALAAGGAVDAASSEHARGCAICQALVRQLRGESLDLGPLLRRLDETAPTNIGESAQVADDEANLVPGYRILETIGEGGQGAVYRAVQESTKQIVALKLLRAGRFATARQRARVEREAELVASLRHPGIVVIHDRLPAKGGQYAIVMELIEGVPLDRWRSTADREGERRRDVLRVFVHMCDAVAFAHRNGVIHRDLKPSNVLVDASGHPRLLDFGIAKAMDDRYAELTLTGDALFTPAYASPEQVMQEPTDTLTDVYSLGVILYKMVCGRFPYRVEGSIRDVAAAICDEEAVPPRQVDPTIDRDLETIILRALQKERRRRYGSVAEFGEDIERYLGQRPIEARRDSVLYVWRLWLQRHRRVMAAGAVVVPVVLTTAGIAAYNVIEAARQRARSTEEGERSGASSDIARQLIEGVDSSLSSRGSGTPRARIQYMLIAADQAVTRRSPEAIATISNEIARVATIADMFSEAESALQQTIRTRQRANEANNPALAQARHDLAELYLSRKDQYLGTSAWLCGLALEARKATFGAGSLEYAESLGLMARIRWMQGARSEALRHVSRVEELVGGEPSGRALSLRARLLRTRAEFAREMFAPSAIPEYEGALRACFEVHGDRHPATLDTMEQLGELLARFGVDEAATLRGARLREVAEELRRPQSPQTLIGALARLLDIKLRIFGEPEDQHLAETHVSIAIQRMIAKDYSGAARSFGDALPILRKTAGERGDATINCLEQIALCEGFAQPQSPLRREAWSRLTELVEGRTVDALDDAVAARHCRSLGRALMDADDPTRALDAYDAGVRKAGGAPFSVQTAELWEGRGWCLVRLGRFEEGARSLDDAFAAYSRLSGVKAMTILRVSARRAVAHLRAGEDAASDGILQSLDAQLGTAATGNTQEEGDVREALLALHGALAERFDLGQSRRVERWLQARGRRTHSR